MSSRRRCGTSRRPWIPGSQGLRVAIQGLGATSADLANNQLAEPRHGAALQKAGIAYVPDYVVNAGGMMGASTVIFDTPSREASIARIHGLHDTIVQILDVAKSEHRPSSDVADEMAQARMNAAKSA